MDNLDILKPKKFINFSTIWEDSDGFRDNSANLYAAYKKSFNSIIEYYKKKTFQIRIFKQIKIINKTQTNLITKIKLLIIIKD